MVELLISKGADVNARDGLGDTPMFPAALGSMFRAQVDSVKILKLLVDHGADINSVDDDGTTPLDLALKGKNKLTAQFIVKNGGKTGDAVKKGDAKKGG